MGMACQALRQGRDSTSCNAAAASEGGQHLRDVGVARRVGHRREGLRDHLLHRLALQKVPLDQPEHVGRFHRRLHLLGPTLAARDTQSPPHCGRHVFYSIWYSGAFHHALSSCCCHVVHSRPCAGPPLALVGLTPSRHTQGASRPVGFSVCDLCQRSAREACASPFHQEFACTCEVA